MRKNFRGLKKILLEKVTQSPNKCFSKNHLTFFITKLQTNKSHNIVPLNLNFPSLNIDGIRTMKTSSKRVDQAFSNGMKTKEKRQTGGKPPASSKGFGRPKDGQYDVILLLHHVFTAFHLACIPSL